MIADGRLRAYRCGPRIIRLRREEVDAAMQPVPAGGAMRVSAPVWVPRCRGCDRALTASRDRARGLCKRWRGEAANDVT